mmetsp:Transcript_24941/g.37306  ORF Transcript_24941/g.37306 Transcript_24941/m.37306 type:complete len:87 (-) Transcript_24941:324-584(-)
MFPMVTLKVISGGEDIMKTVGPGRLTRKKVFCESKVIVSSNSWGRRFMKGWSLITITVKYKERRFRLFGMCLRDILLPKLKNRLAC